MRFIYFYTFFLGTAAKDVQEECGVELKWMTTNCSDAFNVRQYETQKAQEAEKLHALHRIQVQQAAVLTHAGKGIYSKFSRQGFGQNLVSR